MRRGGLILAVAAALAALAAAPVDAAAGLWSWDLTAGFDSYVHTYALATDDTTETISEFLVRAGLDGRSRSGEGNRWRLRAEASAGTDLWRQRFEASYRALDERRAQRWFGDVRLNGRQYRRTTEYVRSSDAVEGRTAAGLTLLSGNRFTAAGEGWFDFRRYDTPSTLEVDRHEWGGAAVLRSRGLEGPVWGLKLRRGRRAHPDSAAIDQTLTSLEADLETAGWDGPSLRLHHRSERRRTRDEAVRPHAWLHGSDLDLQIPAGSGAVRLSWRAERWAYSRPSDIHLDSWRHDGFLGYGWGDLLRARWKLGLAGERFDVDSGPETYSQVGLRGSVEAYGGPVSGSLSLEHGRRVYADAADEALVIDGVPLDLYSDFDYWRIWAMGTWTISPQVSCDVMASYEPESHAEPEDDTSLGYVSVRLVWRP